MGDKKKDIIQLEPESVIPILKHKLIAALSDHIGILLWTPMEKVLLLLLLVFGHLVEFEAFSFLFFMNHHGLLFVFSQFLYVGSKLCKGYILLGSFWIDLNSNGKSITVLASCSWVSCSFCSFSFLLSMNHHGFCKFVFFSPNFYMWVVNYAKGIYFLAHFVLNEAWSFNSLCRRCSRPWGVFKTMPESWIYNSSMVPSAFWGSLGIVPFAS